MKTSTLGYRPVPVAVLGLAALAILGVTSAPALTNVLADRYGNIRWESSGGQSNVNHGGEMKVFMNSGAEEWRGLVAFDLSFLTSDVNFLAITSAVLKLGIPTATWTLSPQSVNLLHKDFVQSQATWNSNSSSSAWATPGASGASDSTNIAAGVSSGTGVTPWANGGLNVTAVANDWAQAPDTSRLGFMIYYLPAVGVDSTTYGVPVLEVGASFAVPEPGVAALLLAGCAVAGLALGRRR
jgi:hypothetical protein